MKTAFWFYILLAAVIILPVLGYGIKWAMKDKKQRTLRWLALGLVCVLAALGSAHIYAISQDYQPLLVAERYTTLYGKTLQGAVEQSQLITSPETAWLNEAAYAYAMEAQPAPVRYQLSDEVTPRYYEESSMFDFVTDVDTAHASPKLVFVSMEYAAGEIGYSLLVLRGQDIAANDKPKVWRVEQHIPATEEMLDFARSQNFIRNEQIMKWFPVK